MNKSDISSRVATASPLKLVTIVFEGLFDAIDEAKMHLENNDLFSFNSEADRAMKIIQELFNSLDFEFELSKGIGSVYFFSKNHLMLGVLKKDFTMFDNVKKVLTPIYEGFVEIASVEEVPDPLISNSTGILAGAMYGKGFLNEQILNSKSGFRA
jgi:flagellar protein FliS